MKIFGGLLNKKDNSSEFEKSFSHLKVMGKSLLKYLVGPNFANGTTDTNEMMQLILGAMNFKIKENSLYLTKEGKDWVINELPKLEKQVAREIQICWKELNE